MGKKIIKPKKTIRYGKIYYLGWKEKDDKKAKKELEQLRKRAKELITWI